METTYTPEFRVSYPNLFTPKMNNMSKKEEYSVTALFAPGANLEPLKNAAKAALKEQFGAKMDNPEFVKKLKIPFRDQSEKVRDDGTMPEGCVKGAIFMNLKSTVKRKPVVVNQQVKPILIESDFYAGCYAVAVVSCYAFDVDGAKGCAFGIQAIQKVREGEPIGGGLIDVNKAFSPVAGSLDSTETVNSAASLL